NDGSPVEIVYPEEGVPVITEPIGIMKDTDQEEAAKAFVDFVLSEEGQQLQAEIGYTPIREGVEAPEGLKSLGDFEALSAPTEELYQNREADKEQFDELFAN
ncbi:extracellular solute-binding protein, partial [Candidatus Pseudothioglobus singularis]|nr:extracellular solute-binding protein [Candidatus Pseudothioglobus singularis]